MTPPTRGDWIAMTLAGVLAGFTLALACSALFARLSTGLLPPSIQAQLTMWLVMPVWLSAMAGSFAFRSGRRAWLWLGAANVAVGAAALLASLL